MSRAITSKPGLGSLTVYTVKPDEEIRLDTIAFTLTADSSAGGHSPEVLLFSLGGFRFARIPDWNDVADAAVVDYTFGIGLTPFCGITNTGGAVQNDLPETTLGDGCTIVIRSVNTLGAVVTGDRLSAITMWVEDVAADSLTAGVVPPYTALPFDEQGSLLDQAAA